MGEALGINTLSEGAAREALTRCCGAHRWVEAMLARRPFADLDAMLALADELWGSMERDDVLEAFAHHPRIGADLSTLRAKFASTSSWSADEQKGALSASDATLERLRQLNLAYEARFGHIFIVCASGKSADEMLALLEQRFDNAPEQELAIAKAEQGKITRLRLTKLSFDTP